MSRYTDWIPKAVTPTPDEVSRVTDPLGVDLREAARDATAPTSDEVHRLMMSRARVRAKLDAELEAQHEGWSWGRPAVLGTAGLLAAAAMAMVMVGGGEPTYGDVALSIGEVHALSSNTVLELGPAIDVTATGQLRIDQADARGTFVTLIDGTASFDVEPGADFRHLVVRAGDTEVEVKGTLFDVTMVNGEVGVVVDHGLVEVRHAGEAFYLATGEQWTVPEMAAQLDVTGSRKLPTLDAVEPVVVDDAAAALSSEPVVLSVPPSAVADSEPVSEAVDVVELEEDHKVAAYEPGHVDHSAASETTGTTMTWKRANRQATAVLANRNAKRDELLVALQMVNEVLEKEGLEVAEREQAMGQRLVLLAMTDGNATAGLVTDINNYLAAHPSTDLKVNLIRGRAQVANGILGDKVLAAQSYRELTSLTSGAEFAEAKAWQGIVAHELGDDREAADALQNALVSGQLDNEELLNLTIATCEQIRRCSVPR